MQHIATRIEALRTSKDLSVLALSERTGIPRMTLSRRLLEPDTFKMSELLRIAAALGVTINELTADAA